MHDLIIANLRGRPVRTAISIAGVALGVVLVILFVGLAHGMASDMQRRASNWRAEIVFTRPGGTALTASSANLSTRYVDLLRETEGVDEVVPVIRYIIPRENSRFGFLQIDGVDWQPFAQMNEMHIVEGMAAQANDEIIIDEKYARDNYLRVGSRVQVLGSEPHIVTGIFAPASGARIKMSLAAMQSVLESPDKCTYILVKCRDGVAPSVVAERINAALPGNRIYFTSDLVVSIEQSIPAFTPFLRTLVGLAIIVSALFVMLSMYTTIAERTREIGILKALGASRLRIVTVIEREALLISLVGLVVGVIVAAGIGLALEWIYELAFEFSFKWVVQTGLIAVAGGLLGALYPAVRAANLDPVQALLQE